MKLSREKIQRMVGADIGGSAGGGGGESMGGFATQAWVDNNYVSIEFFSRLFQAHGTDNGQQTDIDPNDTTSTITSIESMFGFWTDYYLSALGNGGGLGSTLYLSTLADVLISSPANNQVLTYNSTLGKWVNANPQGGVTDLASLTDVTLTQPSANQVLLYDGTNSVWVNSALKTINGQPLYGSGDISVGGGASGNYLPLSGGTVTGNVQIGTSSSRAYTIFGKPSGSDGGILFNDGGVFDWQISTSNRDLFFYSYYSNGIYILFKKEGNLQLSKTLIGEGFIMGSDTTGTFVEETQKRNSLRLQGQDSVNNAYYSTKIGIYGLEVYSSRSESDINLGFTNSTYKIQLNSTSSGFAIWSYNGSWTQELFISNSTHYVGIGAEPSYKLHVVGDIYATGAVTALSDARKKDVQKGVAIGVEQIADAPAVQFLWKDEERRKEGVQVGTLAQYWQAVLPEVVMDKGGELSMQYGVAALVSAIITARKVVDHERRISELEKENERLKTEVEQLRLN